MKAIGLLAGIGTLLREADDIGFEVLGNIETRRMVHAVPHVWDLNFPELPLVPAIDERLETEAFARWYNADFAIGHPPCGKHSTLGNVHSLDLAPEERARRKAKRAADQGLLREFVQLVNTFQPKIFAMDNLPKILDGIAPLTWWEKQLNRYQLDVVIEKNWDYGNVQGRKRLWLIGTRRDLPKFIFKPLKKRPANAPMGTMDVFKGLALLPWEDQPELDHVHHPPHEYPRGGYWTTDRVKMQSMTELAMGFLSLPVNHMWVYQNKTGRIIRKPGRMRAHPMRPCRTLTGMPSVHHPLTGMPLTIRERARVMGWPDDFRLSDGKGMTYQMFHRLVTVTGRGIPSELPRVMFKQVWNHLYRTTIGRRG